jgi:hypothetical protein
MIIHLSPEQQQAVREGRAVEVLDQGANLSLIIVSASAYHQGQELPAPRPDAMPQAAAPPARYPVQQGQPLNVRLRDLPTPSEIAHRVRHATATVWLGRGHRAAEMEDRLKLAYYFAGLHVAYLPSPGGIVIVGAAPTPEEIAPQLAALSSQERGQVVRVSPGPWEGDDTASYSGLLLADEDPHPTS